jgi:hypothetical protein
MRYIKFKQAVADMQIAGEGKIPFDIDGSVGVMCLELSERDIVQLKKNDNRLFILTPLAPSEKRPVYVKIVPYDPFIKTPTNGQN